MICAAAAAAATLAPLSVAAADDEAVEYWLSQGFERDLDDDTAVELELQQRFRPDARADTYYARLWLNQTLSDDLKVSAGVERRADEPGADETRLLQQVSAEQGVLRTRLRLEQRFVDGARMGLRFRPRLGLEAPIGDSRWTAQADAELYLTLRSTSPGGDTGLTGLRTRVGAAYEVNERLSVSLLYLREQDFRRGEPDEIAHVPFVGLEFSL